jgi:signal transduction histidine kinase
VTSIRVNGSDLDLFSYAEGQWALRLAFPKIKKLTLSVAILKGLIPDLAISFPLILIPVWLAIRQGLKPLDVLSKNLARRRDDDLSPLALDMKYAELEKVAEAIESLMQRLRQKIDNERVFIQDAAHELRTPMAVISAQAHVLAHAENPDSRVQAESALGDAIARASHLSEQLLSLASLDHARHLEKVPLDLAFLLQNLLAQMAAAAAERHIDLALEAPDSLLVPMNRVAFHSIVQNLVVNALRYGLEGGHVIVSLSADEREVLLRVADDGPGISRADRGHIFDRFFRGKVQNVTGTGLGLAIVAKATRAMGGTVRVEDGIAGCGVAFVVSFPRFADRA